MKPSVNAVSVKSKHQQLPMKMHQLLTAAEEEGFTDIISWSANGRSFRVHDKERFTAELMPSYFSSTMYKTFQRSLNLWQFRTLLKGADKGSVYHQHFVRGMPGLCDKMTRIRVKCKNARSHLKAKKPPTPTEPQKQQQQQTAHSAKGDSVLLQRLRQLQRPTHVISPSSSMSNIDYTSTAAPTAATPKQASAMYQHSNSQQQYHQGNAAGSFSGPFAAVAPTNHQAPSSSEQQQQQLLLALLSLGSNPQQAQQQQHQQAPVRSQAWSPTSVQAPVHAPPAPAAPNSNSAADANDDGTSLTLNLIATLQQLLTANQAPAPTPPPPPAPTQDNSGLESMLLQLLLPMLNAGSNANSQMSSQSNVTTPQAPPAYTDNPTTTAQPQVSMAYLQALLATGQHASS